MDRFAAMIVLLGTLVVSRTVNAPLISNLGQSLVLIILSLMSVAPMICSCLLVLFYVLYLFMAFEESGVHHAQEFENRFWTAWAAIFMLCILFVQDSPLAGSDYTAVRIAAVILTGYAMHVWDRYTHRLVLLQQPAAAHILRRRTTVQSLLQLQTLGIPVEDQLARINACLADIDQLLIPSTINNFLNLRYVQAKEREIIGLFQDCDARALNYLVGHVKLGLLFYKIKDHMNFHGKHRTELINLLAVERLPILTVPSRVIVLHSLQLLKLRANPKAEYWVRNILLNTHKEDLSELKTLTDAKGDYFCMNKLVYDDICSESIRQDILHHIRREAAIQQTYWQMERRRLPRARPIYNWRKVLSDVDDTLSCSGGMYPAGIDKRYPRKTVYPGVLAFYEELDKGTQGPDEWGPERMGNLVFLSARPHVYKDMSEKQNFAKFEKLRAVREDGRKGMHTTPSLLAGDLASGRQYVVTNDMEPLARKKFDNFRRYVNLYPEYQHVFVCDNGQGDVRAGEMMFDSFPYEFETLYVHVVQDIDKTHGFNLERWKRKEFSPVFFKTYPEAALHAASRHPPLIRLAGLRHICQETVSDFLQIKNFPSRAVKSARRQEINQGLHRANEYLIFRMEEPVELIQAEREWLDGDKVSTPYGNATIKSFDPNHDLYTVELNWSPLDQQVQKHADEQSRLSVRASSSPLETEEQSKLPARASSTRASSAPLETVLEDDEHSGGSPDDSLSVRSTEQQCGEPSAEKPSPVARPSEPTPSLPKEERAFVVTASIRGDQITKFVPPVLPKVDKSASLFKFFETKKDQPVPPQPTVFAPGIEVTTPYGAGTVVKHREKERVVVVEMMGWKATSYLQESIVSPVSRTLIQSLMRQFSSPEPSTKPKEFPYAQGTIIKTPFGEGSVERPLPADKKPDSTTTIGISITAWTLADGSHPMVYCTIETARAWKDKKVDDRSLISSLGSAIVTSSRSLFEPFLQSKPNKDDEGESKKVLFTRYHQDAAAVETPYGMGRVLNFRERDGFYQVSLWSMRNHAQATVFIRGVDLRCYVVPGCQEGCSVLTTLGLSGTLESVEPATSVHIVSIPSSSMICYLQPECIVQPLRAAVGEGVITRYGEGKVIRFNTQTEIYTILLRWQGILHTPGENFDRIAESIQDRKGPFGVDWLLQMLFFTPKDSKSVEPSRSRSNSITSQLSSKLSLG